jgi:hypothetical protein
MKQFPSQKPKDSNHSNQKNSDNNRRFTDKIKAAGLATLSTAMLTMGGGLVKPEQANSQTVQQPKTEQSVESGGINMTNIPLELALKNKKAFNVEPMPFDSNSPLNHEYVVGLNRSTVTIIGPDGVYYNGYKLDSIKKHSFNEIQKKTSELFKGYKSLSNYFDDYSDQRVKIRPMAKVEERRKFVMDKNNNPWMGLGNYNIAEENKTHFDTGVFKGQKQNVLIKDSIYSPKIDSSRGTTSLNVEIDEAVHIKEGQTIDRKITTFYNTDISIANINQLNSVKLVDNSTIYLMNQPIKSARDIYNILGKYANTNNQFVIWMKNAKPEDIQIAVDTTKAMYDKSVAEQVSRVTGSRVEAPAPERFEEDIRTRLLIEKSPNKYLDENNPDPNDFQLFMEDPNGNYKFSAHLMTKEIEAKKTFFDKAKLKTLPVGQEDNNKDGINETVAEGDVMKIPVFGGPNDRVTIFIKDSNGVDTKVIKRGPAHNIVYNLFRASGSPAGKYKMNIRISDENRKITSDKTYDVVFK